MTEMLCRRFLISGRVQGVFFRATTAEEARRLGIRGRVRNLRDGRVEVLAIGEATAVEELARWLWRGSPMSKVEDVQRETLQTEAEFEKLSGFSTD